MPAVHYQQSVRCPRRLQSLAVVLAILAGATGPVARSAENEAQKDQAIDAIESLQGKVEFQYQGHERVCHVNFIRTRIKDDDLRHLKWLPNL